MTTSWSFRTFPQTSHSPKNCAWDQVANAELTDTTAQLFLLYVHGSSQVSLSRIGRAQLAIAPACQGRLTLPRGRVGSAKRPVLVPEPGESNCPFRIQLNDVNADTWDVYAGGEADLTFTDSVIDELTADGHAKIAVRDSEVYADWLSLGSDAQLQVDNSTVGAQRLAKQRPDLATSQVRVSGHSRATFDHVKFDCGVVASGDSSTIIRDPVTSPRIHSTIGPRHRKDRPASSGRGLREGKLIDEA